MIRQVTCGDSSRVIELLQQLWAGKRIQRNKMRKVIEEYVKESSYQICGYEGDGILLGIVTVSIRWALFCAGKVGIIEHRIAEDSEVKGIELSSDYRRKATHGFWEGCGYSKLAFQSRKENNR